MNKPAELAFETVPLWIGGRAVPHEGGARSAPGRAILPERCLGRRLVRMAATSAR